MAPPTITLPSKNQRFAGKPIDQAPDTLKNGWFPPCPQKEKSPEYYALWEIIAKHSLELVIPEIIVSEPLAETRNWTGAVLPTRQREGYNTFNIPPFGPFEAVVGSWSIPNPYPNRNSDGSFKDGEYRFYSWVGLDGWDNPACLKIGVVSMLTVRGGVIVSRGHFPALLIRGYSDKSIKITILKNLPIESGDYVTGFVWSENPAYEGYGCIVNHGTGQYSCAKVDSGGEAFIEGLSAEWIGATENPSPQSHPAPDFGAMFFANGAAVHRSSQEAGMSRALLTNAVDSGSAARRPHNVVVFGPGWASPTEIF